MNAPQIQSFTRVIPMLYAYNTPDIPYHEGWTKIGYTEKQTVEERIKQQTHTAGVRWTLAWKRNALYNDGSGESFTDHDFHNFLERQMNVHRKPETEWFQIDGPRSREYFDVFADRAFKAESANTSEYSLRKEQEEAVRLTQTYFEKGGKEFLWNAKPRFGKTLTSYDLMRRMGFRKVLVVTNRPSIANSWADDFVKFIAWRNEWLFVSDTEALRGHEGVYRYVDFEAKNRSLPASEQRGFLAFESLQGLKGSIYFGGKFDKLRWLSEYEFDLLVVDEAQEGVETMRTERAFEHIRRKHTLYLSGTPFKQLAGDQFSREQIYNWSYADEQEAKESWDNENNNPYDVLPKLNMYTYQLSAMIRDKLQKGLDLSEEEGNVNYAFDLNEFFRTNGSGDFVYEKDIKKFLHALSTQAKYPYSTPELRRELAHSMWYLNRVASAKALAKLLKEDPVFSEYEIILAAGDGKLDEDEESAAAFKRVKSAIQKYAKTITLSCGQLTVGITIPEWSAVLMLCNMQSASSYMQAAFRAQNPCHFVAPDGQHYRKENAYVFDFDPARTLTIFDDFANNLSPETADGRGRHEERSQNIKRLLNFFPVIGEDEEGCMTELDARLVISIPRRLKCQEVVRSGFMSNFLFNNIQHVFAAPDRVRELIEKISPAHEEKGRKRVGLGVVNEVSVDANGEIQLDRKRVMGTAADLFGPKIYSAAIEEMTASLEVMDQAREESIEHQQVDHWIQEAIDDFSQTFVSPIIDHYDLKKGNSSRISKQAENEIEKSLNKIRDDYMQQKTIEALDLDRARHEAEGDLEKIERADQKYQTNMMSATRDLFQELNNAMSATIQNKPQEIIEAMEKARAEEQKNLAEDAIRDHLRGFSRTIPSFIMAYGDENLKLSNFDEYTEDDVFKEVTSISEEEFRFLRDGGNFVNPKSGELEHFDGHLFDEIVFNDSIQEFLSKKNALSNYFDDALDEDIFDYIPPQKTSQIFTPRWVVQKMVDELEEENPGCFDDPEHTFADLYMKSGLFITEIVKRLYRSNKMKELIPDDQSRIRHILQRQVYGLAPSRIIYLIATNYILGFDDTIKREAVFHFRQVDVLDETEKDELALFFDD